MGIESENGWVWQDLDPLTKVVVAAFGERVGDSPGDLSGDAYVAAMTEAFADAETGDVIKGGNYFGYEGLRNELINRLSTSEPDKSHKLLQRLGRLARGNPNVDNEISWMVAAATLKLDREERQLDPNDAKPTMMLLSLFALEHSGLQSK